MDHTANGRRSRGWGVIPVDAVGWLYALVSPAIAAALLWFSVSSTTSGGDYCDPIYESTAERDADYRTASLIVVVGSLTMLVAGVMTVVMLVRRRHTVGSWRGLRLALSIMMVCIAMAGFVIVLVVGADFASDCGGIRL